MGLMLKALAYFSVGRVGKNQNQHRCGCIGTVRISKRVARAFDGKLGPSSNVRAFFLI
jgi:hypothetical protein